MTDLVHVPQHEVVDAVPDLQAAAQLLLADALQELQLVLLSRRQQLGRQSAKRRNMIQDDEKDTMHYGKPGKYYRHDLYMPFLVFMVAPDAFLRDQ